MKRTWEQGWEEGGGRGRREEGEGGKRREEGEGGGGRGEGEGVAENPAVA